MKRKFFLIVLAALLFSACTQGLSPTIEKGKPYYIKNSEWKEVNLADVTASRAAEPSLDQALSIVADYNETTDDDQLVVLTDDVPIEESPDVTIFIVNEGDYVEFVRYTIPRTEFADRRWVYEIDAATWGGLLFVDKVPPVPIIPPDPRTPYEKYAIYIVITETGKIFIEEHCNETWDAHHLEPTWGYESVDAYFDVRLRGVTQEATWSGWTIYSGCIYTEPEEPVEPPIEE